jgi:hypothetical protein
MDSLWAIILAVLSLAGVSAYLVLRRANIGKLRAAARATTLLPSDGVLSWSVPTSISTVELASHTTAKLEQAETPAISYPTESGPDATGGLRSQRHAGLAAASLDAILASLPSLHDLASIDWDVAEGIRLSAASGLDLSRWSDLRGYVDSHYFDVGHPSGFLNRLVGYVGEAKAADHFSSQGADVLVNEAPNIPGYDLTVDDTPFQVKVGGTEDTFETHFDRYPDIPVITGTDNLGIVPSGADVSFIDALDADRVRAATEESLDVVHDDFDSGGPVVPYVTVIRSGLQQLDMLVDGHTDLTTAAKNVGLDASGVGLGGWAGVKVGALIGSILGPAGTVVGGILGGLAGVIGGRAITNDIKYTDLRNKVDEYEGAVTVAQQAIRLMQADAHSQLVAKLAGQQDELRRYITAVHVKLKAKLRGYDRWHRKRCVAFVRVFPKVLDRVETRLRTREQEELGELTRSSLMQRMLWPRLEDVRYKLVGTSFRQRIREVAAAKAEYAALASNTPSQVRADDAIQQIERFVRAHPFESADFDNVCRQLRQVTDASLQQEHRLKQQATAICQSEYGKRLAVVRKQFHDVVNKVSESVSAQAKSVTDAKDRLIREARKVGVNLEDQLES